MAASQPSLSRGGLVDPSTRLRLLSMGSGLKRIALDRGTIHAYIWAPPGQFVVDTPYGGYGGSMGCAYTLQVDDSGAGMVAVLVGRFELDNDFLAGVRRDGELARRVFEGSSAKFRAAGQARFCGQHTQAARRRCRGRTERGSES